MNHGNLPNPVPLEISYADSATISVSPGVPAGTLNQINIYDNARMVVYIWVKNSTYPTGSWQNVNIAGTGGAYRGVLEAYNFRGDQTFAFVNLSSTSSTVIQGWLLAWAVLPVTTDETPITTT